MSRLKICLTNDVLVRFSQVKTEAIGNVYGHFFDGTLVVVGFGLPTSGGDLTSCSAPASLQNHLPTEIDFCGVVTFGQSNEKEETSANVNKLLQTVDITDNPILISCVGDDVQAHIYINDKLEKIPFVTLTNAQLSSSFIYIRLSAQIPLSFEASNWSCGESFDELRRKAGENILAFQLPNVNAILTGSEEFGTSGLTADHMLKDLDIPSPASNKKGFSCEVLPVNLFMKQTKERIDCSESVTAPAIHCMKCTMECIKLFLKIDALAFVHRRTKVTELYSILVSSFCRNLKLLEENLVAQLKEENFKNVSLPEPIHFLPSGLGHFLTVVYPRASKDAELKNQRHIFHQSLGLPLDQPLFRRSQAFMFPSEGSSKSPLINPHCGLSSGVKGGESSLVKGLYSYYHYMLGGFDDNGWGCAYRSLQTIISWFRHQGYTEIEVPSHKRIQECLVDIGDKPSSFIGSRLWIGSTEVSFVLESLLGFPCRILTAGTGEEVSSFGSDLFYHFQSHGTPVMIGGGVLAHTIIGVDYNRSTGEIKFLILDPHYTGRDDVEVVTGKGWVGWKDSKFWDKSAFYNMCLPQRPIGDV